MYGPPDYDGGYDLHIYAYFGHLAVTGTDPYTAPANGPVPGIYGDNQPLELSLVGGLLKLYAVLADVPTY